MLLEKGADKEAKDSVRCAAAAGGLGLGLRRRRVAHTTRAFTRAPAISARQHAADLGVLQR